MSLVKNYSKSKNWHSFDTNGFFPIKKNIWDGWEVICLFINMQFIYRLLIFHVGYKSFSVFTSHHFCLFMYGRSAFSYLIITVT